MLYIILDLVAWFIAVRIIIWLALTFCKNVLIPNMKSKTKKKEIKKNLEGFEKQIKKIYNYFFFILGVLFKMFISAFFAIASKPLIFKLNAPLGEGYALFVSYMMAIALYMILPDFWRLKRTKEVQKR